MKTAQLLLDFVEFGLSYIEDENANGVYNDSCELNSALYVVAHQISCALFVWYDIRNWGTQDVFDYLELSDNYDNFPLIKCDLIKIIDGGV